MASRSKPSRRRESDTDSLEALKPLVVLGLLGMILYGAYSIVQKGPAAPPAALPEAPPFSAQAAPAAVVAGAAAAPQVELPPAPAVTSAPALPSVPAAPPMPSPPVATAPQVPTAPASTAAPPAEPPGTVSPPSAPTYLSAQSAPPPEHADVPLPDAASAPALATAVPALPADAATAPTGVTQAAQREPARLPSAAFAAAWADAHEKLSAGRYAEALAVLSAWYDDASLGVEESQRLEDLLGQLAGTVIYSQQDLLLPPHVVAPGDTLVAVADNHGVPWQLLAKINGIDDPSRLIPGEAIKMIRGPFDAVVSVSRRRLSLQVGGNYAGTFPVVVGRRVQERIGASLAVAEIRRDGAGSPGGQATSSSFVQQVAGQEAMKAILLNDGLRIEAADDPIALADTAPEGSLIVSSRDLNELIDILGPGSHVLIRN